MHMDFADAFLLLLGVAGIVYFMTRWAMSDTDHKKRKRRNS